MNIRWMIGYVAASVLPLYPSSLHAQTYVPSAQECRVAANKLASNPRSEAHRWAITYGRLSECGDIGAKALAAEIRRLSAGDDLHDLQRLALDASLNRHPEIWRAALDVAQRRGAWLPARVASLQILLRQHDVRTALEGGLQRLISERMGPLCRVDVVPHVSYSSEAPLPADYRQRMEAAMSQIAADAVEPGVMRDLARCVGRSVHGIGSWDEMDASDDP